MTDHWQTIEDALLARRLYRYAFAADRAYTVDEVDAALAFVREMRQQPPMPDEVKEAMRLCASAISLAYRRDTHRHIEQDELLAAEKLHKWLDSPSAASGETAGAEE